MEVIHMADSPHHSSSDSPKFRLPRQLPYQPSAGEAALGPRSTPHETSSQNSPTSKPPFSSHIERFLGSAVILPGPRIPTDDAWPDQSEPERPPTDKNDYPPPTDTGEAA